MEGRHDARPARYFRPGEIPIPTPAAAEWKVTVSDGPVIATAIHDGHALRPSLQRLSALDSAVRWREEDPLTSVFTAVGDVRLQAGTSRFEVDLNRPRDGAVYARPEDAWGLELWRAPLPDAELEQSLAAWDRFYAIFTELVDRLLERWPALLLIDLHSYNHRRDGADAPPADQDGNPDIELGVTTADPARWSGVVQRFGEVLRRHPVAGREPDVRENVRFPTGGHFPEWVYARWGSRVCTISPEFKKIFMDEWTGQVDLVALYDLRDSLQAAVDAVRPEFEVRP